MIRQATTEDSERIIEMGKRFVEGTSYKEIISINPSRLEAAISHVIANPDGVVLVSGPETDPTGMIAMLTYDHPFSGARTAFEIVWWVDPEARGDGVRLLRAAEEWARSRGATAVQMVAPNERVGSFYRRLGYAPVEMSYQRSL